VVAHCPVSAVTDYLAARKGLAQRGRRLGMEEPFFVFADGNPTTGGVLNAMLKALAVAVGQSPDGISSHSLRAGAASAAAARGASAVELQALGRGVWGCAMFGVPRWKTSLRARGFGWMWSRQENANTCPHNARQLTRSEVARSMAEGGAVPAGWEAPRPGRDWARVATGLETSWDYPAWPSVAPNTPLEQ